jgi:large subunit ribosomal protein L32
MPNPKRRHSAQRRDKRRTHYKAVAPNVIACPNCGASVQYHRVCPECGYYRGKQAVVKEVNA